MRQIIAIVPRGEGERALRIAQNYDGTNLARLEAAGPDQERDLVLIHVPNHQIDPLLEQLQQIDSLQATITPHGIMALKPPLSQTPEAVIEVSPRSPLEIFLSGLQSVGSWKGFLSYALAAGVIVWIGLFTNTVYLLTAAMLIAPFASPAMNLALGTARGDPTLIGRSLLRYFGSILASVAMAWLFSAMLDQKFATDLMTQISQVSSLAVLIPLIAGAVGALHLCQSERNSLVTAAGAGMLVAASLAPPAGVVGMALAMREWAMAKDGSFVLLLQLTGINLSGALVFSLYGLRPRGVRYTRGQGWLRWASLAATAASLTLLLVWQFWSQPALQRASRIHQIERVITQTIQQSRLADPVEVRARFTRSDTGGKNAVLILAYLQKAWSVQSTDQALKDQLHDQIQRRMEQEGFHVTPWIQLVLLEGPRPTAPGLPWPPEEE